MHVFPANTGFSPVASAMARRFQDRLVMTASISLRMGAAERGSPFHTLYFIIFLQVCQSFLEGFFRLAVRFLMLLPACVPDGGRLAQGRCCGLALLVSNHVGYCQRCSVGSWMCLIILYKFDLAILSDLNEI